MQDQGKDRGKAGGRLPIRAPANTGAAIAPRPGPSRANIAPRPVNARPSTALALRLGKPEPEASASDAQINLLDYWRVIVKRRWTVLSLLAIVCVVVLAVTLLTPSIYRATVTLQIERDTIKVVQVGELNREESAGDRDFYQTQYELLKSRSLAQRVAEQVRLGNSPVAQKMLRASGWSRLLGLFSAPAEAKAEGEPDPNAPAVDHAGYAGFVLNQMVVEPVRNSRLVRVHFDSLDAGFSSTMANAIAESFIAANLEHRLDATSYAKTYLEDRLTQLKQKLQDSEQQLVDFAQKESIVNIDDRQSLVTQQLQQINAALGEAQSDLIKAEARFRQTQNRGDQLSEVLGSELVQKLKEKRAGLIADYQDKLSVYKPAYPAMQQLQQQINEVDKQIAAEVGNIKGGIGADYQAAKAKEQLLEQRLSELKQETLSLQDRSIQYNILKREVDTNRQLYDGLLQRYKEIGVAGGVGTNNISIVDRAMPPHGRFSPSLMRNMALALFLGLALGVMLAFLFEHLDDTVKNPEDVERQFGLAVLGIIPKLKKATPLRELQDPRSAFSESYRSVRTALQFSTDRGVPRTLFVTSSTPGEGKSTTALTLAQNFAQLGKRVLLIDADLRNPSLHRLLDVSNTQGLSNYLAGASRPLAALRGTKIKKLVCLTTGPLPPNPAELLSGPKMMSLLHLVSQTFDQVIIDGPPVLGIADATILSNMAEGTLVVVEAGATRLGYARTVLKRLAAARARILGVVLTKFDARVSGYGYGYGYGEYGYYAYGADAPKRLAKAS